MRVLPASVDLLAQPQDPPTLANIDNTESYQALDDVAAGESFLLVIVISNLRYQNLKSQANPQQIMQPGQMCPTQISFQLTLLKVSFHCFFSFCVRLIMQSSGTSLVSPSSG